MKNKNKWVPSKFIYRKGKLRAARNPAEVGVGSRLITDLVASFYETYLPNYARGKLIDLGCGKVPLFEAYKNYVTDNICVDWKNTKHPNEYLDYECDLTEALPFKDGEFDTIILSDVLEHIPQPENLWQEMSRILAPKGKAFVNTPFYYCLHETPHDYFRYTEYALRRFAKQVGLRIIELRALGGAPEIGADILAKNFLYLPAIGKSLAIAIQSFTIAFIKTVWGKRLSEKTSVLFPLGYFLIAEKP